MLLLSVNLLTSLASPGYWPSVRKAMVAKIAIIVTTIISSTKVKALFFIDKEITPPPVFYLI
jgi:hypothetical protein